MEIDLDTLKPSFAAQQGWSLDTLYRTNNKGDIRVWKISFNGDHLISSWGTMEAYQSGRMQNAIMKVELNSTGRTLEEQARLEAESQWRRKQELDGYRPQIIEKNIYDCEAMLASEYTEKCLKKADWPVWVQPKLDGTRCRAHISSDENTGAPIIHLVSRGAKVINHFNHIRATLQLFIQIVKREIEKHFPKWDSGCRLDGELFTKKHDFDTLSGTTRQGADKTVDDKDYQYYIFDIDFCFNMVFNQRWLFLQHCFALLGEPETQAYISQYNIDINSLVLVPCYTAENHETIVNYTTFFEEQGYEGSIVRRINSEKSYYFYGRCTAMYKMKNFMDKEFMIVGAESAKGTEENCIIWKLRTTEGRDFNVRPTGTFESRKVLYIDYMSNPQKYMGQLYRVKFQNYTKYGVPRFPTGVGFVYDRTPQEVGYK